MSDIGDARIEINGQWVDLQTWLHTQATPEQVERITGRGKGTWGVPKAGYKRTAVCSETDCATCKCHLSSG